MLALLTYGVPVRSHLYVIRVGVAVVDEPVNPVK